MKEVRETTDGLSERTAHILVAVLWVAHACANFLWLKVDTRPPYWDTAGHVITTLNAAQRLLVHDLGGAFRSAYGGSVYPPLVYLVSAPFGALLWPTADVFTGVITGFLALLLYATYRIGRALGGRSVGLLAAFTISMAPIIYGLSRHFLLDVPLTALVALSVWLLLEIVRRADWRVAAAGGLVLGLGLLTKWTFVFFVAGPFLVIAIDASGGRARRVLWCLALAALIGAVVGAPWYVASWGTQLATLREVNVAAYPVAEGDPIVGSVASWMYYVQALLNHQFLLPLTVLLIIAVVVLARDRQGPWRSSVTMRVLIAWLVVSFLVFALIYNKDERFTIPLLPALALFTALGIARVRRLVLRRVLIVLIVACTAVQFVGLTWGLSGRLPVGLLPRRVSVQLGPVPLTLYAENVHVATPARAEDWQVEHILADSLRAAGAIEEGAKLTLTVLPDATYFEPNVFTYFALLGRLPIQVDRVTGIVATPDAEERVLDSDFVVAKSGDQGVPWSAQDAAAFSDRLRNPADALGERFRLIGQYELPDGSAAELYANVALVAE